MIAETTERAVKERPIPFTGEMVRAILEGKKTQTRRVMKPQPTEYWEPHGEMVEIHKMVDGEFVMRRGAPVAIGYGYCNYDGDEGYRCPYGAPGARLYVREAIRANGTGTMAVYDMDRAPVMVEGVSLDWRWKTKYLAARYAPKEASRIRLELLSVRVERVQDITPEDARAEGGQDPSWLETEKARCYPGWCSRFTQLWDRINKARGYGWLVNPWCWVLTFKRLNS